MKTNNNTTTGGGLSFGSALALVFIALKLTGHIDWTWVWVLSPLWMSAAIVLLMLLVLLIVGVWSGR